jgi:copper transport protein
MLKKSVSTVLALLIVLIALFGSARPAYAHAVLLWTDPQDGKTLTEAPKQLHLWFSEPVMLDFTRVELLDVDGHPLSLTPARLDEETMAQLAANGEKKMVLVVDLPGLTPNAYRLNWQTRSADDLHVIGGSVIFGIQRNVNRGTENQTTAETQPDEALFRWLSFSGLAGLTGALALALLLLPRLKQSDETMRFRLQKRLLHLGSWAGVLALLAGFALLFFEGLNGAAWWLILSRTAYGSRWWLGQVALVLLLVVLFGWLRFFRQSFPTRLSRGVLGGLTLLVIAIQAQNSHASGSYNFSLFNAFMDTLHLLGATFWVGGLVMLFLVIVPLLRQEAETKKLAWDCLRGFGLLAGLALLSLVITGLYKSGQQVASLDGLLTTLYGQALLFKLQLALFAALVGLGNAALLHPKVARFLGKLLRRREGWQPFATRHLKRALLVETIVALLVFGVAALLTATQPARGPEFEPVSTSTSAFTPTFSGQAADLQVALSVKPNRPGQNFVNVNVFNTRRPAPAPFGKVIVRLVSKSSPGKDLSLEATPLGNGRYQLAGNYIDSAGDWDISVSIARPGLEESKLTTAWKVLPAQELEGKRPVLISDQPLAPYLNLAVLGLAVLSGVGLLLFGFRHKLSKNFLPKLPPLQQRQFQSLPEEGSGE